MNAWRAAYRSTIDFIGLWEQLHNPDFKPIDFDRFKYESGENAFVLINLEDTNADLIRQGLPQLERLILLREKAFRQLEILKNNSKTLNAIKENLIADTGKND